MQNNPFKFTGPLDPVKDESVCVPRTKSTDYILEGIFRGDYWTILGPRQIGKTTLLRLLMNKLDGYRYVYVDLEVCPENENSFYEWIIGRISEKIPAIPSKNKAIQLHDFGPKLEFYNFLRAFRPKEDVKIVLCFDEMKKSATASAFLHTWRKVYHERSEYPELNKYIVIIAGSIELESLTIGPTSPFNIARKLYVTDFTEDETLQLLESGSHLCGIQFEELAIQHLYCQTQGHPQLAQHLGHIISENAMDESKTMVSKKDVDRAIDRLLLESNNIKTLEEEVRADEKLEGLIREILKGSKLSYLSHHGNTIAGTGPVIQQEKYCAIRNAIYDRALRSFICGRDPEIPNSHESHFEINVYTNSDPPAFNSKLQEQVFLKAFFEQNDIDLELLKDGAALEKLNLDWKLQILFCYLIYKKHKAALEGYLDWRSIPLSHQYRLSSNIENNKAQVPEWDIFITALRKRAVELIGDEIRVWVFKLRKEFERIGANDLIPLEAGRGRGYLIAGDVRFHNKSKPM